MKETERRLQTHSYQLLRRYTNRENDDKKNSVYTKPGSGLLHKSSETDDLIKGFCVNVKAICEHTSGLNKSKRCTEGFFGRKTIIKTKRKEKKK